MQKLGIVAIALVIGTSMALASSVSVPWFIDNAPEANFVPGVNPGVMTLVTLKSQIGGDPLVCSIEYYSADGTALGALHPDPALAALGQNTFTIAPFSALQFRPVAIDPDAITVDPRDGANGVNGGQEGSQGVLVPDRPQDDGKKNGSATISWVGESNWISGQVTIIQTASDGGLISYAHLLGAGA